LKKIITLILMMASLNANAGTPLNAQKIISLANGWNGVNLYIATDLSLTAEDCNSSDKRYVLESSHPQFELLSSMLLSALHAKSRVQLYVEGCGSSNLMKVMSVKIESN
jgi:hypothetical protein